MTPRQEAKRIDAFFGRRPAESVRMRTAAADGDALTAEELWRRHVFLSTCKGRNRFLTSGGCWLRLGIAIARGYAAVACDQIRIEEERIVAGLKPLALQFEVAGTKADALAHIAAITDEDRAWFSTIAYMIDELALADYKDRYPRARGDRLTVYKGHIRGGGDVHCRFCNQILRGRARATLDYSTVPEIRSHLRMCALESLAGIREVVPPKSASTRRKVHVLEAGVTAARGHFVEECRHVEGQNGRSVCLTRGRQYFRITTGAIDVLGGATKLKNRQNAKLLRDGEIYWIDLKTGVVYAVEPEQQLDERQEQPEQEGTAP